MIGGDVLKQRRLRVLTSRCDVGDRREIIPGLYECSQEAAARMVATGAANEDEFTFFAAVCQWSPEQARLLLTSPLAPTLPPGPKSRWCGH